MSFIQLDHIVKTFHDPQRGTRTLAIDDVSLSVAKNPFLCLLGPSGCGKSTLLNMIAGFERPTEGSMRVGGSPVTGPGADRSMVIQQPNLMPWLPVWDNIAFALKLQGVPRKGRIEAAQPFKALPEHHRVRDPQRRRGADPGHTGGDHDSPPRPLSPPPAAR